MQKFDTKELVKPENKGNEIYTAPVPIKWFLGTLAYIFVEPGKACAVIDGEHRIERKQWKLKPFWHDVVVRYVLLEQGSLKTTVNNLRTKEYLYLEPTTIHVEYRVTDPVEVVKLTDPKGALEARIISQFINLVAQYDYDTIANQRSQYEKTICNHLIESGNLPMLKIEKVNFGEMNLKVDLKSNKTLAEAQQEIQRLQQKFALEIQGLKQKLEDEQKEREHWRNVAIKREEAYSSFIKDIIDSGKASGFSPNDILDAIQRKIKQPYSLQSNPQLLPGASVESTVTSGDSRFDKEKQSLDKLVQDGTIENYTFQFNNDGTFCKADIIVTEGTISLVFRNYPDIPPNVVLAAKSGKVGKVQSLPIWNPNKLVVDIFPSLYQSLKKIHAQT